MLIVLYLCIRDALLVYSLATLYTPLSVQPCDELSLDANNFLMCNSNKFKIMMLFEVMSSTTLSSVSSLHVNFL